MNLTGTRFARIICTYLGLGPSHLLFSAHPETNRLSSYTFPSLSSVLCKCEPREKIEFFKFIEKIKFMFLSLSSVLYKCEPIEKIEFFLYVSFSIFCTL